MGHRAASLPNGCNVSDLNASVINWKKDIYRGIMTPILNLMKMFYNRHFISVTAAHTNIVKNKPTHSFMKLMQDDFRQLVRIA